MKSSRLGKRFVASLCVLAASAANAGDGYVSGDVEMHAGPDPTYPTVARVNTGTPVSIQGCVKNWSWCDVVTAQDRGWVAADFLEEDYQGRRVVVPAFGVQAGIPVVTFSFATYWNAHYHARPFYAERARWAKVKPRYAPPMRRPIDPKAGQARTPAGAASHPQGVAPVHSPDAPHADTKTPSSTPQTPRSAPEKSKEPPDKRGDKSPEQGTEKHEH